MDEFLENYKKTVDDIRKEYPNFKVYGDQWMFSIYGKILEEQIINEFIAQTIDINLTIKELKRRFPSIKIEQTKNFIKIYFNKGIKNLFKNEFELIEDVNKFMDSFGWNAFKIDSISPFKEKTLLNKTQNQSELSITYDPKFDTKVEPQGYYYHLTPDLYWEDKIQDNGLTPKNKSKLSNHPERIYLIKKYDEKEFKRLARALFLHIDNPKIKQLINKYYVLQIDIDALIKSGRDKFYRDPHYSLGVWTYENIPPVYIKVIDEISLDTLKNYI